MKKNYKVLIFTILIFTVMVGSLFIDNKFNKNHAEPMNEIDKYSEINDFSKDYSKNYPEIIAELESLYGKERNFKVIKLIKEEIDQRGYRPKECNSSGYITADWQGRYFNDAILRIAFDQNEYFDVINSICMIRSGYVDRFILTLEFENQFSGTIIEASHFNGGASLMVKPDESEDIKLRKEGYINVNGRINVKYEVGMKVTVYYNGKIEGKDMHIYPARVDTVDVLINSNTKEIIDVAYNYSEKATQNIIINKYNAKVYYLETSTTEPVYVVDKAGKHITIKDRSILMVDFQTNVKDRLPNNYIVVIDKNTKEFLGFGLLD